jgi:hypothetical protein
VEACAGRTGGRGDSTGRSLAVLAGIVLVPVAVIVGLVWFFMNATDLELSAFVLIGLAKAGGLGWAWRAIRARLAPGSGGDGPAGPG